ncbi:MAG: hypothetical protein GXP42_14250 [Chloroflexi bacterium]|nr:hypothetical protein [Chloroflexota bacterium]
MSFYRSIILSLHRLALMLLGALVVTIGHSSTTRAETSLTCTSASPSGNWSAAATWDCGRVPAAGDAVVIAAGHTVTIDTDTAALASLTIDGVLQFDATGIGRTVTVNGDITVNSGDSLTVSTSGTATTHSLIVGGDISNAGVFDARPASSYVFDVTFNKAGDQTINNTGTLTFNKVILSKGSVANRVLASGNITVGGGAADFDPAIGTWEQTSGTLSKSGGNIDVASTGGLAFTGSGGLNLAVNASLISAGNLTINTTGTVAVGRGANRLEISGGTATLSAGTIDIGGRLRLGGGSTTIDGATILIDPQKTSALGGTNDVFSAAGAANITMSGGSITIVDPNANADTGAEIALTAGTGVKTFSGGTIYLGDGVSASAGGDAFEIDSDGVSLANLTIRNQQGGAGRTVQLLNSALSLSGSLTIESGGALDANGQNMSLHGDWTNDGSFTAGAGTVTFAGSAAQIIAGSVSTAFNNLAVNSSATVSVPLANQPTVEGTLTNNGNLRQTRTVGASTTPFLWLTNATASISKYFGMDLAGSSLGSTTVTISGHHSACPNVANGSYPVQRCYLVAPGSAGTVGPVVFYYEYSELQTAKGQDPAKLFVWKDNGDGSWTKITPSARSACSGGIQCSVSVNSLTLSSGSNRFVLAQYNPQSVTLENFTAIAHPEGVELVWETVSELDCLGFNLDRRKPTGEWRRLNPEPILCQSPGAAQAHTYRWLDDAVAPGQTYFYRLTHIGLDGVRQIVGEVEVSTISRSIFLWLPLTLL